MADRENGAVVLSAVPTTSSSPTPGSPLAPDLHDETPDVLPSTVAAVVVDESKEDSRGPLVYKQKEIQIEDDITEDETKVAGAGAQELHPSAPSIDGKSGRMKREEDLLDLALQDLTIEEALATTATLSPKVPDLPFDEAILDATLKDLNLIESSLPLGNPPQGSLPFVSTSAPSPPVARVVSSTFSPVAPGAEIAAPASPPIDITPKRPNEQSGAERADPVPLTRPHKDAGGFADWIVPLVGIGAGAVLLGAFALFQSRS